MQAFANLYTALDETTKTGEKVDALIAYLDSAPPEDAAWAIYFLIGRRPRQAVPTARLRAWAAEISGVPDWLFGESYDAVGDFAETVALLLPDPQDAPDAADPDVPQTLAALIERVVLPLRSLAEEQQRALVVAVWRQFGQRERFLFNKLITGGFRVGVSQLLVTRAIASVGGTEQNAVAHRLMGAWQPSAAWYAGLLAPETADADASRPYPFCLAHPLEGEPDELGPREEWQVEWKWDGIRAQLIRRGGAAYLWSRGEELITERFPEIAAAAAWLPEGTVIDGEVLPWIDERVMPFAQLQRRIGRKDVGKKLLAEVPVVLLAYDLLEASGVDLRDRPLTERRALLERLLGGDIPGLLLSPIVVADGWEELGRQWVTSRDRGVEGFMLKRRTSAYRVGRVRGDWWKWKVAPYTVDAVLTMAQRGSGKRASLYSDYTFAVWDEGALVPFAKAYSGLTDAEIRQVDSFVRRNTREKFGPVRSVTPELVFELAFEAIQRSSRHKSGLAVRFPRILRWRTDKRIEDADSLDAIKAMLPDAAP